MQLNNLSVAKKIWALVLAIMVLLISASVGTASYLNRLEADSRVHTKDMEGRILLIHRLRLAMDLGGMTSAAAKLAKDAPSQQFFETRFQSVKQSNARLMQEFFQRVTGPESEGLMTQLMAQLKKCDDLIDALEVRRLAGEVVDAQVRSDMVAEIDTFMRMLDDMVALQTQLLDRNLQASDVARQTAWVAALLIFVAVVVMGFWVAAWLVRQMTQPLARAVAFAKEIENGNLTHDVQDDRRDEMGDLLRSLNAMNRQLRGLVGEVHQGVEAVSTAADQIAAGNHNLSSRTEQTAANLEETAASMEELTATVTQSAETAHQAQLLAGSAVQAAERGGHVVGLVVTSMEHINTSSRKINDIIGVIDGIAFQTNILALNAAVEAARAGEQGRGFAVVAGEVRSLAQRSAEAAKEIKGLIATSVGNVERGTAQVNQAGQSMDEIVASVRQVTDLIEAISAAAQEQRDGISQVNQAVSNLDQMTQQNAALVEESTVAAASMNAQARRLAEQVAAFRIQAL